MEEKIINRENLNKLCRDIIDGGNILIAPGKTEYTVIKDTSEIILDAGSKPTKASYKNYAFPKAEPVIYYKKDKNDIELIDIDIKGKKTVILGAKPCDSNSFSILSKVFNWDYKDDFFNMRVKNFIVIGMMCEFADKYCFCTSVGLSPVSEKGSDIFLIPLDENNFAVRIITDKGKEFMEPYGKYLTEGNPEKAKAKTEAVKSSAKMPEKVFNSEEVRKWLGKNFEHPFWDGIGDVCLSCAQCAFVCPVCHCFDIVDEDYSYEEGRRMKNWDGCQFGHFTLHASGHNPRDIQGKRYRQRINHKFKYYVDKFGEILCTGCGRCSRGCPVSIDIKEIVSDTVKN